MLPWSHRFFFLATHCDRTCLSTFAKLGCVSSSFVIESTFLTSKHFILPSIMFFYLHPSLFALISSAHLFDHLQILYFSAYPWLIADQFLLGFLFNLLFLSSFPIFNSLFCLTVINFESSDFFSVLRILYFETSRTLHSSQINCLNFNKHISYSIRQLFYH